MKHRLIIVLSLCLFIGVNTNIIAQNNGLVITDNQNGLTLNKGQKWEIDKSMMTYLHKMENSINTDMTSDMSSYGVLAESLVSNVNTLVSTCSMEGPAHDELHKWLVPYIGLVNELTEIDNTADATKTLLHLKKEFVTFNQFFK